jgi:hypothetical protein
MKLGAGRWFAVIAGALVVAGAVLGLSFADLVPDGVPYRLRWLVVVPGFWIA